jgi:hypothetical protein
MANENIKEYLLRQLDRKIAHFKNELDFAEQMKKVVEDAFKEKGE